MGKAVDLGENKALSALTYEVQGDGNEILGALFYIPTRKEGDKTFYSKLGVKTPITKEQRHDIIRMLGGTPNE